jgi:hypothetical protein
LLGSSLLTLWLSIRHRSLIAAHGSAGCLALAGMGTSVESIDSQALRIVRWAFTALRRLIPDTITQWGIVAIAAAFLLLGIGAIVSLKAAPPAKGESLT